MLVQVAQLMAVIGADTRPLEQGLGRGRSLIQGFGQDIRNMASTAAGFLVRDVVVGGFNLVRESIEGAGRAMIDTNRQFELFEAQFAVQLRSHERAIDRMKEIEQFAVLTPFNLDQVVEADLILQNFGLHSQEAARRFGYSGQQIRTIAGDVAAGTRASFEEMSLWIGRFAAGDTGQAIMRMQELGVTTRAELAAMGVEFSKSGQMVSPLDQAMTALLRVMERKFGGLMEMEAGTLRGMESNLEDYMIRQRRIWGEPVFDAYKEGLSGLLSFLDSEGGQRATSLAQDLWFSLVGSVRDAAGDFAHELAGLARDAFYWGANILEQLGAGIEGSDAVSRALRSIGDEIAYWLTPGSPPKLLPGLTEWGAGAARAYIDGWVSATPDIAPRLADAFKSLQPFLQEIDLDGTFDADAQGRFREAFGVEAPQFEGYIQAYANLSRAAQEAAQAQEAYDEAVAGGDQSVIDTARQKLDGAQAEERAARTRLTAEQQRIAERMQQELRLTQAIQRQTQAIEQRSNREEDAARKAAEREADAERRRQEAEAKRVADARLQWELAQQDTAGQIGIWQRELTGVEEGGAEYYNILTRIIGLEKRLQDERARLAREGAGGFGGLLGDGADAEEAKKEAEQYFHDSGAGLAQKEKTDWLAIGALWAEAIWTGATDWIREKVDEVVQGWVDELTSAESLDKAGEAGRAYAESIIQKLTGEFRSPEGRKLTGDELAAHLKAGESPLVTAAKEMGRAFAEGFVEELKAQWDERGGLLGVLGLPKSFADLVNEAAGTPAGQDINDYWNVQPPRTGRGGYFATGTRNFPGGWAIVGEDGPELVAPPRGSSIFPAMETERMLGGTTNHITINISAPGGDAKKIEIGVLHGLRAAGITP